MIRDEINEDEDSPYTVEYKYGESDRTGSQPTRTKQIEALSQPTGDKDRARLPDGDRYKVSRFWAMVDDNTVDLGNWITFNGHQYEIKFIQEWTAGTLKAIGVRVS